MPNVQYTLVANGPDANITVVVPDQALPLVAQSSHPNFGSIVAACTAQDDSVNFPELFDVSIAVARRFDLLSERIKVADGVIYLDGDPIHSSLTNQILRFLEEGVKDWKPLVAFFERVQSNPNVHSREQLYDWLLNQEGITISPIGNVVGYKGVGRASNGEFVSLHSGSAIVDGKSVTGRIPNEIGSTVEMPRSQVAHDPSAACHCGLHVGTFRYAQSYAQGGMLECHVNPRDVVSVPTDAGGEKVRVCRYIIAGTIETAYNSAVIDVDGERPGLYDDEDEWELLDDLA